MKDIASRSYLNDATPVLSAPARRRRRSVVLALGALLALGVVVAWWLCLPQAQPALAAPAGTPSLCIVAPGKVEAVVGERRLALDSSGVIRRVHVSEGATVEAGQLLVELVNDDAVARLDGARHDLVNAGARLRMLKNGPRPEEIEQMRSELEALRTTHEYFEKILKHRLVMRAGSAASSEEVLEFQMRSDESRKRRDATDARLKLLLAGTREEEIAMAVAAQAAAEAKVKELAAVLERTRLRAPSPGKALRLLPCACSTAKERPSSPLRQRRSSCSPTRASSRFARNLMKRR
jgi:multidrug efflux pump subunit AcrA (membrane-fusion protein)